MSDDELRPEYDLAFERPNRFAKRLEDNSIAIVDEDEADVLDVDTEATGS